MQKKSSPLLRYALLAAKLLAGGLVIGWLAWQAQKDDKFQQLAQEPKNWGFLLTAVTLSAFTVVISFVRWRVVAYAANVPLSLGEAMRFGALGYVLNFVSPGSVGGDVFKAAVLAKDRPGRRTAAVTTVVIDRVMALISFLIFASCGYCIMLLRGMDLPTEIRIAGWFAVACCVTLPIVLTLLLSPGFVNARRISLVKRLPVVGGVGGQLLESWAEYRKRLPALALALCLAFASHFGLISAFYFVSLGLPLSGPGWLQHAFMVPFACLSGSIPLFPAGLGAMEAALDYLYQWMGAAPRNGAFVAFGYRLTTVAVAFVAAPYYFTHQAMVRRAMHDQQTSAEPAAEPA